QRLARVRVELERQAQPTRMRDLHRLEIDRQLVRVRHRRLQRGERLVTELDRRHPVLDRIRAEDVAEARRDYDAEAVVLEPPGCMLARRTAPEVAAGDQDLCARVLGPVELEVGILRPVEEEELAVAGALDPLQELLRHDLVGVDVGAVEYRNASGQTDERLHPSSRTSVKWPAI